MHASAVGMKCMQGLYVLDACKGCRYEMHARDICIDDICIRCMQRF